MLERTEPDWGMERAELRRFVLHRLQTRFRQAVADDELEGCVQDALVRLYRWWCREGDAGRAIGSLDAMKNRVAEFAVVDLIRGKVRERRTVPLGPPGPDDGEGSGVGLDPERIPAPAASPVLDAPERLRFVILEFFRRENAPCLEIGHHFYAKRSWQVVAGELGLQPDAVKQRWSRCVKAFREFLTLHPEVRDWVFEESA
jgi:DNA-directed RNA polymerase specialized sigma24 family protein